MQKKMKRKKATISERLKIIITLERLWVPRRSRKKGKRKEILIGIIKENEKPFCSSWSKKMRKSELSSSYLPRERSISFVLNFFRDP